MMQPKKSLQAIFCNLKRCYKQDATTLAGAISEIPQHKKVLQAKFCNLRRSYKQNAAT